MVWKAGKDQRQCFCVSLGCYTYFQWTEDRQGFQIQYLPLDFDPEVAKLLRHIMISLSYDYISLLFNFLRNFQVEYLESIIAFVKIAHLQSIKNECKTADWVCTQRNVTLLISRRVCFSNSVSFKAWKHEDAHADKETKHKNIFESLC